MECCYNDKCGGSLKKIIWSALEERKLNSDMAKCIWRVKWLKKKYSLWFALPNNVQVQYFMVLLLFLFMVVDWNQHEMFVSRKLFFLEMQFFAKKIIAWKKN